VVEVAHRVLRTYHELVRIGRIEMEYARLPVINPDDGVIMTLHRFLHEAYRDRLAFDEREFSE
jgi:hypothetical protein